MIDHLETWDVVDNYFKFNKKYLTKHHLDSFNDFVINKIPQTLVNIILNFVQRIR